MTAPTWLIVGAALAAAWLQQAPGQAVKPEPRATPQAAAEAEPDEAACSRMRRRMQALRFQGKLAEAIAEAERLIALERKLYGQGDARLARSLDWLADRYREAGEEAKAVPLRKECLAIRKKALGAAHAATYEASNRLVDLCELLGDFDTAEALLKQQVADASGLLGSNPWRAADAQRRLQYSAALKSAPQAAREQVREAERLAVRAALLDATGQASQAVAAAEKAYGIFKKQLAPGHWRTADCAMQLGSLCYNDGQRDRAEVLFLEAMQSYGRTHGDQHLHYARAAERLAWVWILSVPEKRAIARPIVLHAEHVKALTLGEEHPEYCEVLRVMAYMYAHLRAFPLSQQLLQVAEKALRKTRGTDDPDYARCVADLGAMFLASSDAKRAEPYLRQAEALERDLWGEPKANTLDHLSSVCSLKREWGEAAAFLSQSIALGRKSGSAGPAQIAAQLRNLGTMYINLGDFDRAEKTLRESLDAWREISGEKSAEYAEALRILALTYHAKSDPARGDEVFEKAVQTWKGVPGDQRAGQARCLMEWAGVHQQRGDFVRAEEMAKEALDLWRGLQGETGQDFIDCKWLLAELCMAKGNLTRAREIYTEVRETIRKTAGESHPAYGVCLVGLAEVHSRMLDDAAAERLLKQAVESLRSSADHRANYLKCLSNLGQLAQQDEQYDEAASYFQQAAEVARQSEGERSLAYSDRLAELGDLHVAARDYSKAEPVLRKCLEIRKQSLGDKHLAVAAVLASLARLHVALGQADRAVPLCEQVLAIRKSVLGEEDLDVARALCDLALVHRAQGDVDAAEPLLREAVAISRAKLGLLLGGHSAAAQRIAARQQRTYLDAYLALAAQSGRFEDRAYRHVLAWKGQILSRQRAVRALAENPALEPLLDELQEVSSALARHVLQKADPKNPRAWMRKSEELSGRKQRLETDLAAKSRELGATAEEVTPEDVTKVLPDGFALVDFLEYTVAPLPGQGPAEKAQQDAEESRLLAFIVRKDAPIAMIDLGPAEAIEDAVEAWREDFGQTPAGAEAAAALRDLMWQPLAAKLAGSGVVLISPDGEVGRLPFGALPGQKPESYLLEERTFAIVPGAQLLPSFVKEPEGRRPEGNMLVVGAVNYDARPGEEGARTIRKFGRSAVSEYDELKFAPLSATRGEMAAIEKMYRDNFGDEGFTSLEAGQATEEAFRRQATRHLYLHLATHGFYMPKKLLGLSVDNEHIEDLFPLLMGHFRTIGINPGVLSGIALAGANKPDPKGDDGILTAEEVATVNLRGVELVVLSACETGLGMEEHGEGLMGLQRSFHVAGARTVVSTLWNVPDAATRNLMERFYDNLWNKRMSKLEALREAQLWMMREGDSRGAVRLDRNDAEAPRRATPEVWAGFVLSGYWR